MAINAWSFTIPSMESEEPEKDEWENQLWADRHKPIDPNDLCIPSRKVNDVERIIRGSSIYNSHSKLKVLLLTGKTGTGKSTMIKLLAQKMDIQIIEWEAEHRIKNDPDYVSTMERFEDFMHGTILRQTLNQNNRKKMILLDDIPDLTSSLIKDRFHEILTRYILDRHPFFMVITISEATSDSVSSTYNSTETRMTQAHDVLPDSLTDSAFVRNITINPVTAATMKKKLANIIKKEHSSARDSDRDAIIDMAEGDLRIAINHLQFYFPPGRKGSQNPISEEIKMGSNPLTLFHALGKVLYAKRNPDNTLESKPENIIDGLPSTADHFIAHIHSNLPHYRSLEDLERCLEYMVAADTMRPHEYAEDHTLRESRGLISVAGSMISRKDPIPPNPPRFRTLTRLDLPHVSRSERLVDIAVTLPRGYQESKQDEQNWDRVSDFTSDEEENFDDIFGDGSEWADMEF